MGITRLPTKRLTTLGTWMQTALRIDTLPANNNVFLHRILVPFKHKLLKAYLFFGALDNVGAVTAKLHRGASGAAAAQIGATMSDTELATSANAKAVGFTLAAADMADTAANSLYTVELIGTNAGDIIYDPGLALLVQPVPRNAL